jgi:SAM-dependent methyltransferase
VAHADNVMSDPRQAGPTGRNLANYDSAWSVSEYGERIQGLFPMEETLVREFLPSPCRVLDLGCGAGRTTIELCQRGHQATGIDLSTALLAHGRQRHPELDLREMDATALAFGDASFDAAWFSYNGIDCLYPLSARERCFAEVHRVLRPGGVFLLSTHNALGALLSGGYFYLQGHVNAMRWLWRQRGNAHLGEGYWAYDDPGGVQYLYSAAPARTEAQARAAGFDVVRIVGATGEHDPHRIHRHQQHVHFVLRRPA